MVAALDYMDAEDTADLRAATRAPTGLETLGTYSEDGADGADRPAQRSHDSATIGDTPTALHRLYCPPESARSVGAAPDTDSLFAVLYGLIDEAERTKLYGAAGILRSTIFGLTYGRSTIAESAATLRELESSYRETVDKLGLRDGDPIVDTAGFYGRAAAVIESWAK